MHSDDGSTTGGLLLLHYFELMFGLENYMLNTVYNGLFLCWIEPSTCVILVFYFCKRIIYFWQVINIVFNSQEDSHRYCKFVNYISI